MKIIVCGSRDWPLEQSWRITNTLWSLYQVAMSLNHEILAVVHGACPTGVDAIADGWVRHSATLVAADLPIGVLQYPADWNQYGKQAGPIRNRRMAEAGADLCLAFLYEPEGRWSAGTRSMMEQATISEIPVWSVTIH